MDELPNTEIIKTDEDGNRVCPVCTCHYKNIDHKCPEWLLAIMKYKP